MSTERNDGWVDVCVRARVGVCKCGQASLCVSIFIRSAEENPITVVSVEIKEIDLWWLQVEHGFVSVHVCLWVCVRQMQGRWRFYVDTDVGEKKDNNKMETEKKGFRNVKEGRRVHICDWPYAANTTSFMLTQLLLDQLVISSWWYTIVGMLSLIII